MELERTTDLGAPTAGLGQAPAPVEQPITVNPEEDWHTSDGMPCEQGADGCYPPGMTGEDSMARFDADLLDREAAAMLRGDWERFMDMYTPVIDRLEGFVKDKDYANRQAEHARGIGLRAGTAAAQQAQRDVDRYGVGMGERMRGQLTNTMALNRTAGGVQAGNRTRGSMLDHRLAVMSDLTAFGHGTSGNALAGLATASANANSMANTLQQQQYAADQAGRSRNYQIAGSIIGGLGTAML